MAKGQHYLKPKRERDFDLYQGKITNAKFLAENKEKIFEFIELCRAKNRSIASQVHYLNTMAKFCSMFPEKRFTDITQKDTMQFKKWLDSKYSARTISGHLAELKHFLTWANGGKITPECIDWFKSSDIKFEKTFTAKDILSQEEIIALAKSTEPEFKERDSALILSLWESGCRAGEWAQIKQSDISSEDGIFRVSVSGKTGERDVFLINSALSLTHWLERHPFKAEKDFYVWCGLGKGAKRKDQHIEVENVYRIVKAAAKNSGIRKPITSHALRHSRATFVAKQKFNESLMRQMFGWSAISRMPSTYTALSATDLKNALRGKESAQEAPITPEKCPWCKTVNPLDKTFCVSCGRPLSLETILNQQKEKELETLERFRGMIKEIVKEEMRAEKG